MYKYAIDPPFAISELDTMRMKFMEDGETITIKSGIHSAEIRKDANASESAMNRDHFYALNGWESYFIRALIAQVQVIRNDGTEEVEEQYCVE